MFWGEFRRPLAALDRCTLNKGAFAFKIVRGALKWPLKGGSRLIEVAATAGLTVIIISRDPDLHNIKDDLGRIHLNISAKGVLFVINRITSLVQF